MDKQMSLENEPWPEHYYDACEFFYWEPQHFRRGKIPPKPPELKKDNGSDRFRQTLDSMEVSLNHILNFTFKLAQDQLIKELTKHSFGHSWDDNYYMVGRNYEQRYNLPVNATQPDFMFDGQSHILSIEMKIAAKTNAVQLAKYLYLHAKAAAVYSKTKRHGLIFLGPKTWAQLWGDKQALSFEERLAEAVEKAPQTVGRSRETVDQAALQNMAKQMQLGYLSYQEFAQILNSMCNRTVETGWEALVARNLIDGTIAELARRGLVDRELLT
jgi:hypothetical protein